MRHRITATLASAVVGAVLLSGCQTPAPSASPTGEPAVTSPTESEQATVTPTPTPEPDPSQEPSQDPEPLPEAVAPTAAGDNEILAPVDGATVRGPRVTISGTGTAFEATLLWRVVNASTETVVAEDFTMAGSMGEIGPFEIEVDLDPGIYHAEVWAPDMSDGEAGGPDQIDLVAVTFVVE